MNIRNLGDLKPRIAESAYIDESAVVIGDVTIGEHSSVWPLVVLRGDDQAIVIGDRSNIQDGSVIHGASDNEVYPGGIPAIIGDDVVVGHKVILHACTIGNQCLIGMSSIVLDGAVIEEGTILGAGSLVPIGKRLESGYLYLGSPARRVRELKEKEKYLLKYGANHYVELKEAYKAEDESVNT